MGIILKHPDGSTVGTYFTQDAHDVANKIFVATGERCTCVDEAGEADDYLFPPESEDEDNGKASAKKKSGAEQLHEAEAAAKK